MANLWQFFGLPDPEGNAPAQRSAPSSLSEEPTAVSLEASPSETTIRKALDKHAQTPNVFIFLLYFCFIFLPVFLLFLILLLLLTLLFLFLFFYTFVCFLCY